MNNRHQQILKRSLIVITIFFIAHMSGLLVPPLHQWIDNRVYNLFFHLRQFFRGEQSVSPHLLLFTLDDAFEKKYNTPGTERLKIAEIFNNIRGLGARTILLDIIFRQRDNIPIDDEQLVQSTYSSGNIFYPLNLKRSTKLGEDLPEFLSEKILWDVKTSGRGRAFEVKMGITPFPELCRAAKGLGGITLLPDSDGIIHRIPLVYSFHEKFIPSLVLAGICHYFRVVPADITLTFGKHILLPNAVLPGGLVKDILIPIDYKGQLIVNYTGPWTTSVTSFSLENLVTSNDEPDRLKRIFPEAHPSTLVIIGDMTTGAKDLTRGVFDENYPMIGIIHNSLNTILTENYLIQPGPWEQITISLLFLLILILINILIKDVIRPSWFFILFCIYFVIAYILFIINGRLPDISLHFSAFILSGILLFRLELKEIKIQIHEDDAMEIPDISAGSDSPNTVVLTDMTIEQQHTLHKRLVNLGLSDTQIEVAVLLVQGLQYKEIGGRLNVKATAVGRRINRIYRRFGINNKVEFINIVYADAEK